MTQLKKISIIPLLMILFVSTYLGLSSFGTAVVPSLNTPTDMSFTQNGTVHVINWIATDADVNGNGTYYFYQNGTLQAVGGWISGDIIGNGFENQLRWLKAGNWNLTIKINDGFEDWDEDMVIVSVTNDLTVITAPADVSYELGTTGHFLEWTVTDYCTKYGWMTIDVYQDSILLSSEESYLSMTTISTNIDGFAIGFYIYNIITYDDYVYMNNTVYVSVCNVIPRVDSPQDVTYVVGTTGNWINWTFTDYSRESGAIITLFVDNVDTTTVSFNFDIYHFNLNVDGVTSGIHNYTVIGYDGINSSLDALTEDSVMVLTISTNTIPTISHPADVTYIVGSTGNLLTWQITDPDVNYPHYDMYVNSVFNASSTWYSGLNTQYAIDTLPVGTYTFVITAYDGIGSSVSDTVIVTVKYDDPVLTHPADITYQVGGNKEISWTVNCANTATTSYTITQNSVQVATGSWYNGALISYYTYLAVGEYTFEIIVDNGYGNSASDSVKVTVTAANSDSNSTSSSSSSQSEENNKTPTIDGFPTFIFVVNIAFILAVGAAIIKKQRKVE